MDDLAQRVWKALEKPCTINDIMVRARCLEHEARATARRMKSQGLIVRHEKWNGYDVVVWERRLPKQEGHDGRVSGAPAGA